MNITINKKAQALINTFTKRESAIYGYIITLLKSDLDNFKAVDIALKAGDDKAKEGYKKVFAMCERACFILQCFNHYNNVLPKNS